LIIVIDLHFYRFVLCKLISAQVLAHVTDSVVVLIKIQMNKNWFVYRRYVTSESELH